MYIIKKEELEAYHAQFSEKALTDAAIYNEARIKSEGIPDAECGFIDGAKWARDKMSRLPAKQMTLLSKKLTK